MSLQGTHIPRAMHIASRIEEDIRSRQLRPGDAYLNTQEIAQLLSVSKSTANRAMQLLAKRHVVHRRQRRGVVIGEGIVPSTRPPLRCVHLLVRENFLRTEGIVGDGMMVGIQQELPGVEVQLNFPSSVDETETINRLIATALRSPEPEGFVLVRAPLVVQRLMQSIGLPTVVHGTLFPSVQDLPWIDFDHRQIARALVANLLNRGCRRLLYLGRDRIFPGDYHFQDGLMEALNDAKLPASAISIRHLPADHELVKAEVRTLLARSKAASSPSDASASDLGIIAQTEPLAEGAIAAGEALGMSVGRDVAVVSSIVYRVGSERPLRYPHIRAAIDPRELGVHIGRMLVAQARGRVAQPSHEIIPFELRDRTA